MHALVTFQYETMIYNNPENLSRSVLHICMFTFSTYTGLHVTLIFIHNVPNPFEP